jgi:hypothetical protein
MANTESERTRSNNEGIRQGISGINRGQKTVGTKENVANSNTRFSNGTNEEIFSRGQTSNTSSAQEEEIKMWPTPRANKVIPMITDKNREKLANRNKSNLEEEVAGHCGQATGSLNPTWVEWLMGYPAGYTDLKDWEILSSRKSQKNYIGIN